MGKKVRGNGGTRGGHGDRLLCRAGGQFYRGPGRSPRRPGGLPGLGGPVRRDAGRTAARAAVCQPRGAGQAAAGGGGGTGPAGHRDGARPGEPGGGRERPAPAARRPRRPGGAVRRGRPHAADGRLPGRGVHRLRPPFPGAPADPGQGGRLQHAPARDRRPPPVPPRRPVVDAGAPRPARLERRPAAPDPGRAPAGGAAHVRGARGAGSPPTGGNRGRRPRGSSRRRQRAWLAARRTDLRWARLHAAPWVARRVRGASSGDGISPKRPELLPL